MNTPRAIGTVLPTAKSLAAADRHSDALRQKAIKRADSTLGDMTKRTVGGETRYYKTATVYAVVSPRSGALKWFESRADGDYSIKEPAR